MKLKLYMSRLTGGKKLVDGSWKESSGEKLSGETGREGSEGLKNSKRKSLGRGEEKRKYGNHRLQGKRSKIKIDNSGTSGKIPKI